jgi:hypothetical protein
VLRLQKWREATKNLIFVAPEDIHKTAFRVPGVVGLFEVHIHKTAFRVVKSTSTGWHLEYLHQVFE